MILIFNNENVLLYHVALHVVYRSVTIIDLSIHDSRDGAQFKYFALVVTRFVTLPFFMPI